MHVPLLLAHPRRFLQLGVFDVLSNLQVRRFVTTLEIRLVFPLRKLGSSTCIIFRIGSISLEESSPPDFAFWYPAKRWFASSLAPSVLLGAALCQRRAPTASPVVLGFQRPYGCSPPRALDLPLPPPQRGDLRRNRAGG